MSVCRSLRWGDRAVGWVAARQLGLITTLQLELVGIGQSRIRSRLRRGTLQRIHRGVYLVGHKVLLPGAIELAALMACGQASVVSHQSATALWGLTPSPANEVQVTIWGCENRSRTGIWIHRVKRLDPRDRRIKNGIPVTSPARSLLDYAGVATPDKLERAIAEANALRLVSEEQLHEAMERAPKRPGVAMLWAELRREGGPRWTRREGERRMLQLVRDARLPPPVTNGRVAGFEADFLWPDHQLIVEFDGYQYHGHRAAFERDRRRDAAHVTAGYRVIRVTWRQLVEEPLAVAVIIARALEVCGRG